MGYRHEWGSTESRLQAAAERRLPARRRRSSGAVGTAMPAMYATCPDCGRTVSAAQLATLGCWSCRRPARNA